MAEVGDMRLVVFLLVVAFLMSACAVETPQADTPQISGDNNVVDESPGVQTPTTPAAPDEYDNLDNTDDVFRAIHDALDSLE
jgi:hypothetical protein